MSGIYRMVVDVEVEDETKLIAYARTQYTKCWGNQIEEVMQEDDTLVERALVEALVLSNENPSPADYGIAIVDHTVQPISS